MTLSRIALVRSTSALALATCLFLPASAFAQTGTGDSAEPAATADATAQQDALADGPVADEIVITGIRASLERSIAIKRNSAGVVDAISAEDIGKFPDTNLAESLQRVPGVSINRVNGEGSQVTVRGFGPGYNLVTLNGRTLAATSIGVVGGDGNADGAQGTSRSFDFDNLASEGVRTLEVYKTGRAAIPSGGIGATINVVTRRPLDTRDGGLTGGVGVKAVYDTSVEECIDCGDKVTPEANAFVSWSNPTQTFGISLFGSYQKRNFSTASAGGNGWNLVPYSDFVGNLAVGARVENAPTDPSTLISFPNDSRANFSENRRERINGQAVVQFRPFDALTITADALYAQNRQSELRSDSSNWFNRTYDEVIFDGDSVVNTAVYLHEVIAGTKDGPGSENQHRATKNKLRDFGLNLVYDLTDTFSIALDGHMSKSQSLPDNPLGHTSTLVAMAGKGIDTHSVDYRGKAPIMAFTFNDTNNSGTGGPGAWGNRNGTLDVGDIGSQVARSFTTTQTHRLDELRADAGWDLGGGSRFDFGTNYRDSKVRSTQVGTYQALGDWGVANPGDVEALAPGMVQEFCLACKFSNLDLQATGEAEKAYRTQDVTGLYSILSAAYPAGGLPNMIDNSVAEKIWSVYGQVTWKGELAGSPTSVVAGLRYEKTKSTSTSLQGVPLSIVWQADNDFTTIQSAELEALEETSKYDNLLPSIDFRIEPMDNLVVRASYSKTIARTDYSNLFSATSVFAPNRSTFRGGVPTAASGNPSLVPLESDNYDLSVEYYYKPDSYVSLGYFNKRVRNFVGAGLSNGALFGLRNPTSGAPGTRSGVAAAELSRIGVDANDIHLFAMTALIEQRGSVAAASSEFLDNYDTTKRALSQSYADTLFQQYDITADASDPLFDFTITRPINNKDAKLWGFELQAQHFFGDTGFGVAAAYTLVRGDVGIDRGADPSVDQFALIGLSDTLNATLIYDKGGLSARLAYNWRDKFLSQLNRDSYKNMVFTEPYGQVDLNINYEINPNWAISFEAINLTEEGIRQHMRTKNQLIFVQELQRRFMLGVRFRL